MLILIGTVPTAYALNRALPERASDRGSSTSQLGLPLQQSNRGQGRSGFSVIRQSAAGRDQLRPPNTRSSTRAPIPRWPSWSSDISQAGRSQYGIVSSKVPARTWSANTRNDMYLTFPKRLRFLMKDQGQPELSGRSQVATLNAYKGERSTASTKFIPYWVKIAVAIWRSGCGTMIGWKRIVITVGEKIGKTHLTYGAGRLRPRLTAAMGTIMQRPTAMAFRSRPPMCCRPASPGRWRRTARASRWRRSATSRSPGS